MAQAHVYHRWKVIHTLRDTVLIVGSAWPAEMGKAGPTSPLDGDE
jgi:hypothetical protein